MVQSIFRAYKALSLATVVSLALGQSGFAEAKQSSKLTADQVFNSKILVDRHAITIGGEYTVSGITKKITVDKDEDDNDYWMIAPEHDQDLFSDLDGDGDGDAALFFKRDDDLHLVVLKNENGKPVQICDFILEHTYSLPKTLKFQNGKITAGWFLYDPSRDREVTFKIVGTKVVAERSSPVHIKGKIVPVELSPNPRDVPHAVMPPRVPKMITRNPVDSGVTASKLTDKVIKQGLARLKKKLDLVDEYNGFGKPLSIAYGDLNGDGRPDAAVLFIIDHADNGEVRLIPAVLDKGHLKFVGAAGVAAQGFDTSDVRASVKDGIIKVEVRPIDRDGDRTAIKPWVPLRFKLYQGKQLIKVKYKAIR